MQENIKTFTFGCRLNALECEKIAAMLGPHFDHAIVINTCSVTAEAERGCAQFARRQRRENPDTPIFITGCGATRAPEIFGAIGTVVANKDKLKLEKYTKSVECKVQSVNNDKSALYTLHSTLSKAYVQIQNGCDWNCAYCITRILRGPSISFCYDAIMADVRTAVANGFYEIVLTGIDIASYPNLPGLCENLLSDVPEIRRLRLSSMDPASREIPKIIELMQTNPRMMPHLHLSMQSGSDPILGAMRRRHNANMVKKLAMVGITTSWDIICGFPGEVDELFSDTVALAQQLRPIKIHAFPFSPRPGTAAADMPNQIPRNVSKARVKIITDVANENLAAFMAEQLGRTVSVLVENKNLGRTPDDIEVLIQGDPIAPRTICDIEIIGIEKNRFIGKIKL